MKSGFLNTGISGSSIWMRHAAPAMRKPAAEFPLRCYRSFMTPRTVTAAINSKKPAGSNPGKEKIFKSKLAYKGKVFSVYTDDVLEPNGIRSTRDVIRHSGSVVILAVDESTTPEDPQILIERQYRHAAGQYLFELPAGRIDEGETPLAAAKRELIEETGYRAAKWSKLVRYYASPGFLGESMQVFLAQGIRSGIAEPEADESIVIHMMPLSTVMKMIATGQVLDGKTILGVQFYANTREK
jgi:ADP-ribose pyrophosphatase